jgi:hypothetical protein
MQVYQGSEGYVENIENNGKERLCNRKGIIS